MRVHNKKAMKKNVKYKIIIVKYIEAHRARNGCNCSDEVLNMINGRRVWTRVRFDCGEIKKINCNCLEKI
jgi:hypothetical protein